MNGLSAEERREIEQLDIVKNELQVEYDKLYFDPESVKL